MVARPAERNTTTWPADQPAANRPADQHTGNWATDQPATNRPADQQTPDWAEQQAPGRPSAGRHTSGHAEPRPAADPRYSDYGRPGSYGYAGADDGQPQTTRFDYEDVHETSSRLRQPAYLTDYPPAELPDEGRHRADDQPGDWPPREWPPPRR